MESYVYVVLFIFLGVILTLPFCRRRTVVLGSVFALVRFGIELASFAVGLVIFIFALKGAWPYILAWEQQTLPDLSENLQTWQGNFTISRFQSPGTNSGYQYRFSLDLNDTRQYSFFAAKRYTLASANMPKIDANLCRTLAQPNLSQAAHEYIKTAFAAAEHQAAIKHLLLELLYLLDHSIRTLNRPLIIGVRGYADGQFGPWREPLTQATYKNIVVSEANAPPLLYKIGAYYDNQDLPNLRAQFLKKSLLEPYIQQCHPERALEIQILNGEIYDFIDRAKRKAEVYVMLDRR
jgi:hypothetical protein